MSVLFPHYRGIDFYARIADWRMCRQERYLACRRGPKAAKPRTRLMAVLKAMRARNQRPFRRRRYFGAPSR